MPIKIKLEALARRPLVPTGDQIADFETNVIEHEALLTAKLSIDELRSRFRRKGLRQLKARMLIAAGPAGSGKSTLLEHYAEALPDIKGGPDGDIRPVVLVETPEHPTRRAFVAAIMAALGYKARDAWDTNAIIERIAWLCDQLQVQLLLIDEAHHIVLAKTKEGEEHIAEFLKGLLNRIKTQIVLCGLPVLLQLREYEQLNRRSEPPVLLHPYSWATVEGRARFLAMLGLFEMQMSLPEPSLLFGMDFARAIYCSTGGYPGLVSKDLSHGLVVARRVNSRRLDRDILAEAWGEFNDIGPVPLSLDPYAAPVPEETLRIQSKINPYKATGADFDEAWKRMVERHSEMGAACRLKRPKQVLGQDSRKLPYAA
jgi:type II secretory pathway predicted ATPase ExeA